MFDPWLKKNLGSLIDHFRKIDGCNKGSIDKARNELGKVACTD